MGRKFVFSILCVAMFIVTGFSTAGTAYAKEDIESDNTKYEAILDLNVWLEDFLSDEFSGEFGEDYAQFIEVLDDVIGITNWEQLELSVKSQGKTLEMQSVIRFTGDTDGDSLSAQFSHWGPGKSSTPSNMSREGLMGMYAVGNPLGAFDAKMTWLVNTSSLSRVILAIPFEDEFIPLGLLWSAFKMTLKGYWYTAREDVYPMFGDAVTMSLYANEDFLGWEESYNAERVMNALPVKFIIAIDLGEDGLVEELNAAVEDYIFLLEDTLYSSYSRRRYKFPEPTYYPSTPDESEVISLKSKKILGQQIDYLSIGDDFELAWMAYDDVLFISDLDTIENIDSYYTPGVSNDVPEKFNEYMYVNFDGIVDTFLTPFEDELIEELEWILDSNDSESLEELKLMARKITGGRLGTLELMDIYDYDKVTTRVTLTQDTADLLLMGLNLLEILKEEGMAMFELGGRSAYWETNPARHPDLGEGETFFMPYPPKSF